MTTYINLDERLLRYQAIEDNGGGLHLYVFDGQSCVYAGHEYEYAHGHLTEDMTALDNGDDTSTWAPGSNSPQEDYDDTTSYEYGWKIVAAGEGGKRELFWDRMGAAASLEFNS